MNTGVGPRTADFGLRTSDFGLQTSHFGPWSRTSHRRSWRFRFWEPAVWSPRS